MFKLIRCLGVFFCLNLISGVGPSGAAPEQTTLLHVVQYAQSAAAALLPPGLLGGGGGGDQPGHGGQLADAAGQLRGTTNTDCVCEGGSVDMLLFNTYKVYLLKWQRAPSSLNVNITT